ncbi:MAG: hypothetical protein CFE44_10765, partial [Burkholderiales bacterium PBB4]
RATLEAGLEYTLFDGSQINVNPLAGQESRRSLPLSLGYAARMETDTSIWGYNATIALNLPLGNAGNLAAYQSEDPRVTTVHWKALRGGGNYATALPSGWLWSVRGQFQYSPDSLISGEQFGLGGASSVRGTSERPLSGDSGVLMSTELTSPEWMPGLRVVGFADAGWLSNNATIPNAKPSQDSLSSVGLGLRYAVGNYSVNADYGRVITGSATSPLSVSGTPQAGDQKLHINVAARF